MLPPESQGPCPTLLPFALFCINHDGCGTIIYKKYFTFILQMIYFSISLQKVIICETI